MAKLLTTYYISITRYLVVLCQEWCLYHSYVRKNIKVRILQHHNGPLGSSSGQCYCFFRGFRHSLSGLTCCPCRFRMLGFDRSQISLLFLVGWSPYSSWCTGTCKDWYLSFPSRSTGYLCIVTWGRPITCLAFCKFNSAIISPNVVFFGTPTTRARIYFAFNKYSFDVMQTHLRFYACPTTKAWLLACPSTPSFCLSFAHFFYNISYSFQYTTFYIYTSFTMSMWSYHWWFWYPFAMLPMQEWTHYNPWYILRYLCSYCIGESNPCIERGFSLFPPPHTKTNGYCHHQRQFSNLGKCCHY